MRSTAGAGVHAIDSHHSDLAVVILLAAVVHLGKLGRRGEKCLHAHVLTDGRVGTSLDVQHVIGRQDAVKVDLDATLAHVKAHVVVAKERVHDARDNVFACVRLHVVTTPGPVKRPVHAGTNRKRDVREMDDFARAIARDRFAHVCHEDIVTRANAQRPAVTRLASTCGVERGLV